MSMIPTLEQKGPGKIPRKSLSILNGQLLEQIPTCLGPGIHLSSDRFRNRWSWDEGILRNPIKVWVCSLIQQLSAKLLVELSVVSQSEKGVASFPC